MKKIEKNKLLTVKMNKKQLNEIIYWIVLKFKKDDYHNQFISNKNDDIGCFFDRWIERFPEYVIFNELLLNKNYTVVKDNFLYGQNTKKNSPDIIGIEDEENIYPLALFKDGNWEMVNNAPFVETKTFKKYQKLITIPKSQFDENKYYAIIISNLKDDYLLNLFDDEFFSERNYNMMKINENFIKSDENNMIIKPVELKKPNDIGYFELIGIYKGKNIEKISILTQNNPRYLKSIEKRKIKKEKKFELKEGLYYHLKTEENNVPIFIEKENNSKIHVLGIGKTYVDILVEGTIIIDCTKLSNNTYRLNYSIFKRGSNKKELVLSKNTILQTLKSEHSKLTKEFEEFMEKTTWRFKKHE